MIGAIAERPGVDRSRVIVDGGGRGDKAGIETVSATKKVIIFCMGIRGEEQASDLSTSLRIHSQKRPELSDIELIKTSPWDLVTLATILDQHNHDHVTVITPAKAIPGLKDIVNISLEHDAQVIIFSGDLSYASHIRTSDKVTKIEKGGHPTEILDAIANSFQSQADADKV